jgi:hypothetical protein
MASLWTLSIVAFVLVACDDEQVFEPAVKAFDEVLQALGDGELNLAYALLHPLQQLVLSEEAFVACFQSLVPPGFGVTKLRDASEETAPIPGTGMMAPAAALTVDSEYYVGDDLRTATGTYHMFAVDGSWRWVVSVDQLEMCRA